MFERASGGLPAEMPPPGSMPATGPITDLADARALQILATEHWSLLATRSLVYNEAFTRASMFVTAVTGSVIALGFVAQAAGFGGEFGWFAFLILLLDLVLGLGTLRRMDAINIEDFRCIQGMNRLRHAYLEIAPGLGRYFVTDSYDDAEAVTRTYGGLPESPSAGALTSAIHGLSTVGVAVGLVVAMLAGALVGIVFVQLRLSVGIVLAGGIAGFVFMTAMLGFVGDRSIRQLQVSLDQTSTFPTPSDAPHT